MARQGFPSDKQDQFVVRLPEGLRDQIKIVATKNRRSMNAEVVAALEDHIASSSLIDVSMPFTEPDQPGDVPVEVREAMLKIIDRIGNDTQRLSTWLIMTDRKR